LRYRRIVGLGLSVIDHLYVVERLRLDDMRLRYDERRVQSGGMMGTALAQAARLGCDAHLLSLHGDDAEGRLVRRALRAAGVKTGRVRRSRAACTTVAVVLVARRGGERRFLVPDRRELERRAPRFDLSLIDRGTLLLVDGHFPAQALRAVKRARRVGATVIADLNRASPGALALLPFVDYPIVPLEFGAGPARGRPERLLRRLHAAGGGTPVVTLGARGGLYLAEGRVRRYRAWRVPVVDTTGAGDVFHGAFAAGLYYGLALADALDLAAHAAALACTALGGMGRLMSRRELRPHLTARARPDRRG
jgi:sugar/nucleoside kinase (ribokinase family)